MTGLYRTGTRLTKRFLILEDPNTFLAKAAVVVLPPKPFASGNAYATPRFM